MSRAPVRYVEMRGAEHAFDVFASVRTVQTVEAVERFLDAEHRAYLAGQRARAPASLTATVPG